MIFLCGLCALCGLAILMFLSFSSSEISPDSTEKLNLSSTEGTENTEETPLHSSVFSVPSVVKSSPFYGFIHFARVALSSNCRFRMSRA